MRRLLFVAMCFVCAGSACGQPRVDRFKKEPGPLRTQKDTLEGKQPPELQVKNWVNNAGQDIKLGDQKGKVVVLDFWGVWCGPCKAAMPKLKKLHDQYKDKGLVIIGVHTTKDGEKMAEYAKEAGLAWPTAVDANGQTVNAFHVDAFPAYYLIDRDGKLRVADLVGADLESAIEILLQEKVAAGTK